MGLITLRRDAAALVGYHSRTGCAVTNFLMGESDEGLESRCNSICWYPLLPLSTGIFAAFPITPPTDIFI